MDKPRCIYKIIFPDKSIYIGLTHNLKYRMNIRKHSDKDTVTKYANKTHQAYTVEQITAYIPEKEASKIEQELVRYYIDNKYHVLNVSAAGGLGGYNNNFKWTKEKCAELALTCKRRVDFQRKFKNAYQAARNRGWLTELCEHMGEPQQINTNFKYIPSQKCIHSKSI